MFIVLLLGDNFEYLNCLRFDTLNQAEEFVETYYDIVLANIVGELKLKERIKLVPEYYPFLGKTKNMYIVEFNKINKGWIKDDNS